MTNSPSLLDPTLEQLLALDKEHLETSDLPIVTVSATYKEDLKSWYGFEADDTTPDIVFSRAHYSMALGIAVEAWQTQMDPQKAWLIDPTNYVNRKNLKQVQLTEVIGKTLARNPILKAFKDLVDKFGRNKLPILKSITPSLLYLTRDINKPILSMHVAAGNILAESGKTVFQMITDPHVRGDYTQNAHLPNLYFGVFDDRTKAEFMEKARLSGIKASAERIIVTGPPIDPRIIAARFNKKPHHSGKLRLCLTTGGLGTNKPEIRRVLEQLLPELRRHDDWLQLVVYAGTQADINDMVIEMAREARVSLGKPHEKGQALRLLYHPQIVDANEMLIKYGFPWADGFISKPSGDMAYDAAAAGCFLLTLAEWGEWEHNVREVFEQKNIARRAQVEQIVAQIKALSEPLEGQKSWMENAMCEALSIDELFLNGAKKIASATKSIK